jgi:formylglycine-generating enzyme required for sulfatase activity
MVRRVAIALLVALMLAPGCARTAPPPPQLLVYLDTDAPVVGQLSSHPELSADAAIDTVSIDVVGGSVGSAQSPHAEFVAPDESDWQDDSGKPRAWFGLATPAGRGGQSVVLLVRAFRASLASPELGPPPESAIARLVEATLPAAGIVRLRVVLASDCRGVTPSITRGTTCIDASRTSAAAADGVDTIADGADVGPRVAVWSGAKEVACGAGATQDRLCVPGGFTLLGDDALAGFALDTFLSATPLRPAIVSPFLMDRTEFTVGRFRALVLAGKIAATPRAIDPADPLFKGCTWLGATDASNDRLPANCVDWPVARAACVAEGGDLPTEAQWEHAARGRGQRRRYPWGDADPSCCAASYSRGDGSGGQSLVCGSASGIEPAGSHPASGVACGGVGDESRDGVLDLAGSVTEAILDAAKPYSAACWQSASGVAHDPSCVDTTTARPVHVGRGGNWTAGPDLLASAARQNYPGIGPEAGFRCAYPGAP